MRMTRIGLVLALVSVACGMQERERLSGAKSEARKLAQSVVRERSDMSSVAGEAGKNSSEPAAIPRKIIRNVDLGLSVADADAFLRAIEGLASRSGGYVADRQVQHDGSHVQGGTIVLRIPAERLDGASESLRALGTVESESLRAEDISDQYYDLDSRLTNARNLEARLLKLLAERAGQLADVIAMESKLSEVREQIERLEGKQRLWDSQVALATIRLTFRVPVAVTVVEPGFFADVRSTFSESVDALGFVSKRLVFAVTALVPWSPLIIGAILLIRRLLRRERAAATGT